MDVIFDIDGTLANAKHRLHFINDNAHWTTSGGKPPRPNWEAFLADDQVAKDTPIPQTWSILSTMLKFPSDYRVIFITGRKESTRRMTYSWLTEPTCDHRGCAALVWKKQSLYQGKTVGPILYMRSESDRRPSDVVKESLLFRARADGFHPDLAFEDRKEDAAMWRRNGLLCCQVAEGNY